METKTRGIVDLGTPEQKAKLYQMKELVSAPAQIRLEETSPDKWKVYPRRNQGSQDSCVFHARAKAAGILNEMTTGKFVEYSASDYNKRSNKDLPSPNNAGAYPIEAFDLWRKEGIGLENTEPSNDVPKDEFESQKQNTFQKQIAGVSALSEYYALPAGDFDAIVGTLAITKKPIPIGIFATFQEYNRDMPRVDGVLDLRSAPVRHEVCATPNVGIYQGQEGFTIEDSWGSAGINGSGVRWITRAFFTARNYIPGLVPARFKTFAQLGIEPKKPQVYIGQTLTYGMTHPDVIALQDVLKYEGLFPAERDSTGYYGNVTARGVLAFQKKYQVAPAEELETLAGQVVGPQTLRKLNTLYK